MDSVRVILQAVNTNNLEIAQRTVDSEVKKSPTSDVYLSLKVFVASRRNDRQQALETAQRAVVVCSKKTLEMFLLPVLIEYNAADLLSAAFVRVNRIDSADHEICETWLETSLLLGDLDSAQKALMAMQRTSKKPRSVCFQACFIMAMDVNSNPKLFPALADRMIQKYLPAKTPQESFVVAHIYKMSSVEKMVAYLLEEQVRKTFVDGSLDLQLLLLNGLLQTQEWQQLFDYASDQLHRIDSYNYWEVLNTASIELNKPFEHWSNFHSFNSYLARVDLAQKKLKKTGFDDATVQELNSAIQQYWEKFGSKASTYKYLKPFINTTTIKLLEAKAQDSLGAKITYAKFRQLVEDPLPLPDLLAIHERHLNEVPPEKTDYFLGTDALLMAAQRILRGNSNDRAVKAAIVLEHAVATDPHNFYVRLLLVQIYQSLGVYNLASTHFNALSIRNIQLETLGYLLSTRVSSVSPESSKALLKKLAMAYGRIPHFGAYTMASLTENSFTQFDGVYKLGQKLRLSLDHCLVVLEQIRSARISRGSVNFADLHLLPDPNTTILHDNRDFEVAAFDDGTHSQSSLVPALFVGPIPRALYVEVQRLKELACQALLQKTCTVDEKSLQELVVRCAASDEFTDIEKWNVSSVVDIVLRKKDAVVQAPPSFDTTQPLSWSLYHWCNTILETVKIGKLAKSRIGFSAESMIKNCISSYQSQLNAWENTINQSFRESGLPGDASKVLRAIKQEQMGKLKTLLEM